VGGTVAARQPDVRWYRSFYFRIGFTFVLFVVSLLTLQSLMFGLVRGPSPVRDRPPNTVVAIVAADLGAALLQDRATDLDAYLKREYVRSQPNLCRDEDRRHNFEPQGAAGVRPAALRRTPAGRRS
jgi:hypothetical protein